jgi:nucleotide-binding universal stress UspA family protein
MLPLRSILAATDLTGACDDVLRAAAGLARATGAALHVVHSFDFPQSPYFDQYVYLTFQDRLDESEQALEEQIARCVPADVPVASRRMDVYAAARAIAEYAAAVKADLVVLGPHAKRPLEAGFLGTTADRVIRTVEVPVLVVRGALELPLRRVLVPVDLSERTGSVLDVGLAWAAGLGAHGGALPVAEAEMLIIHVVPRVLAPGRLAFNRATVLPGMNREVEDALARHGGAASVEVSEEVVWGDRPDREIVRVAGESAAGLVVVATHGYGPVKRALIGGTASGVARAAPCPVLLVPPRVWRITPPAASVLAEAALP